MKFCALLLFSIVNFSCTTGGGAENSSSLSAVGTENSGVGEIGNGGLRFGIEIPHFMIKYDQTGTVNSDFAYQLAPVLGAAGVFSMQNPYPVTENDNETPAVLTIRQGLCDSADYTGQDSQSEILAYGRKSIQCKSEGCIDEGVDQSAFFTNSGTVHPGFAPGEYCAKMYFFSKRQSQRVSCAKNLLLVQGDLSRVGDHFICGKHSADFSSEVYIRLPKENLSGEIASVEKSD